MSENAKGGAGFQVSPRMWAGVAIAVVALAFILQNRQVVSINILLVSLMAPLWTALVGVFAAGLATGWLVSRRKG